MLYLDLTARNDISSALPVDNNSYFYWSAATSFVFTEVGDISFLDFGKVRLNYAEVGNDTGPNRTTTPTRELTILVQQYCTLTQQLLTIQNFVHESLTSFEAGLELAAVDNRLRFDLGLYKQISGDQIVSVELSKSTGASFKWLNGGEIENRGIEVSLGYDIIKNANFNWNLTANWAKNVSEVNSLPEGIDNYQINSFQGGVSLNATVGQPYGVLRGTGYSYLNGQPTINASGYPVAIADQVIGNPNPDWTGGIMNTFTYKSLAFGFLVDMSQGGEVFSLDMHYGLGVGLPEETGGLNELGNPIRDALVFNEPGNPAAGYASNSGGIIFPGVQADGSVNTVRARADYYGGAYYWGNATRQPNSMHIYDASFAKLREVTITYKLPKSLFGGNVFQNASISAVGSNLWIINKNVPHADPESGLSAGNGQGYLSGSYPTMRTYGFKLDLTF